jgi:hypothetical protein
LYSSSLPMLSLPLLGTDCLSFLPHGGPPSPPSPKLTPFPSDPRQQPASMSGTIKDHDWVYIYLYNRAYNWIFSCRCNRNSWIYSFPIIKDEEGQRITRSTAVSVRRHHWIPAILITGGELELPLSFL